MLKKYITGMNAPERIYLSPPQLTGNERLYVQEALDSNWIAPTGPFVNRVEKILAEYTGQSVVALNSGTAAIHLALRLCGVGPGDEVLCPTFSFIASAAPVTYLGAKPVFVDCEAQTWNMDLNLLETAIRERRRAGARVKAVIFAYCYGMPGFMEEVSALCARNNLALIEDAAEALGSTWHNRPAGTFGDYGVYSFNGNKIATGSVGGALICKDPSAAARARKLAHQAKENMPHFEHHEIGYNYALSNLAAAIICAQLEQLNQKVQQRRAIFSAYCEQLDHIATYSFQQEPQGAYANRWLSTFVFSSTSHVQADMLRQNLSARNIESRPLWKPLHLQKAFNGCHSFLNQQAEKLFASGICLPSAQLCQLYQV